MIYSNEKTLGIFEDYIDIYRYLDIITELRFHKIIYFINLQNKNLQKMQLMEGLIKLNIKVLPQAKYHMNICDIIWADPKKINSDVLNSVFCHNESFIYFWNEHNNTFKLSSNRNTFFLFSTYRQLENFIIQNHIQNYQFSSHYQADFVFADNLTLSVVGHCLPKSTKEQDKELEDRINKFFNPDLPAISFVNNGLLREKTVKQALESLAVKYNVIVLSDKHIDFLSTNIICCDYWLASYVVNRVKVNLVSIFSEDLVNYCLEAVPTIPVYTRYIDLLIKGGNVISGTGSERGKNSRFRSFTALFQQYNTSNDFLTYFNPVDIQDTFFLTYHIENGVYWKKYQNKVEESCQKLVGAFYKNDIKRTVDIIKKILKYNDLSMVRKIL